MKHTDFIFDEDSNSSVHLIITEFDINKRKGKIHVNKQQGT